jgi:hypothetical protein
MVHTNSELMALQRSIGAGKMYEKIIQIDSRTRQFVIMVFITASVIASVFHVGPEAIALPDIFTPESAAMLERIFTASAFAFALGGPDLLTNLALILEAAVKLFIEQVNEHAPITNVAINTVEEGHDHSHSHEHEEAQVSTCCGFKI